MWKLCYRLGLLTLVVAALQLTVVVGLQERREVGKFERALAPPLEVLYFGDSTNRWIDPADTDRRTLAAMLSDALGGLRVGVVDGPAYQLEVFEAFLDLLIARDVRPQAIVLSINLRSFSPEWDARPSYQFEQGKRELRHADDRLALALMPVLRTLQLQQDESLGTAGFLATPVYRGQAVAGRVRDFEAPHYQQPTPERTRDKLIYHYMGALDPTHRKLEALRRIGAKARAHGWRVLCYVTPIDVATGEALLPGELRAQVSRNLAVIAAQWPSDLPPVLDLALALPAAQFSYELYPNEHLKQGGRQLVAQRVAEGLRTAFGLGGG